MGPVGIATSNDLLIELRIMSIIELLERHDARKDITESPCHQIRCRTTN